MTRRRNVRIVVVALAGVVLLAALGWAAARQIRSPAQVAADTAPPAASLISVPVEHRALVTEVIVRGTVRFGAPQEVVLPTSALKAQATAVVSRLPKPGATIGEGENGLSVSGRPVFVLRGATPMHRDLGPGADGADVRQLEEALARMGHSPGAVDGRYDGSTAAAVAALYVRSNEAPFGVTDLQADQLRTAEATAATARDGLLQMRLSLRNAARGATNAEINQAQLDAIAAEESLATLRQAVTMANGKLLTARDAYAAAQRAEVDTRAGQGPEVALADADVVAKRAALSEAVDNRTTAELALRSAPADTTPADRRALELAVRRATEAVDVAAANLYAAERVADSARSADLRAIGQAQLEVRRTRREVTNAEAELSAARAAVPIGERKRGYAHTRIAILRQRPDVALEREIVAAAQSDVSRTAADLRRLASKTGVQVPADEILFFPTLPLRVDSVTAARGSQVTGSVMRVTNSRLAIDSSLSLGDAKLVRPGMRVTIEEPDLRVRTTGTVSRVADRPGAPLTPLATAGTGGQSAAGTIDPGRVYAEVVPTSAPASLAGASVKLSIGVESTNGKVLAVPIGALSVSADGRSRVQVDLGRGRTRFVTVEPGLAAQGFVEVRPVGRARLREGDRVVIGSGAAAARKAPSQSSGLPAPPATAPGSPAAPGTTTGPGTTPGAQPPTTPAAPAAPASPPSTTTGPAPTPPSPATPTPGASRGP